MLGSNFEFEHVESCAPVNPVPTGRDKSKLFLREGEGGGGLRFDHASIVKLSKRNGNFAIEIFNDGYIFNELRSILNFYLNF